MNQSTINVPPSADSAFEVEVMRSLRHTAELAKANHRRERVLIGQSAKPKPVRRIGDKPVIYNPANRD